MSWFGIPIAQGSLSHKYLHGIGASAATIAVSTFLAATGRTVAGQAIAFGLLARLVSMTLMILTDQEKSVGMRFSMFGVMWLVLLVNVYCLLTGTGNPLVLTKVISLVLGIHGMFLYLKPNVFLRKSAIAIGPGKLNQILQNIAYFSHYFSLDIIGTCLPQRSISGRNACSGRRLHVCLCYNNRSSGA